MSKNRTSDGASATRTRTETVYRLLRRAILEQALKPGTRLPEDQVGEQVGVSRTIVRSALTRLAAEGLVELRPNRGAMVASPTIGEAREVFAVRIWLERAVVAQLARGLTQRQLTSLEGHVEREQNAKGRDGPQAIRLAGEFHILLAELTGNKLLIRYVNETVSRCSLILALYGVLHSSECAVSEHRAIIGALRKGDARAAEDLMVAHLGAVADRAEIVTPPSALDLRGVLARYAEPVP